MESIPQHPGALKAQLRKCVNVLRNLFLALAGTNATANSFKGAAYHSCPLYVVQV